MKPDPLTPTLPTPEESAAYLQTQRERDPRLDHLLKLCDGDAWIGEDGIAVRLHPTGVSTEIGGLIHWLVARDIPGLTLETGFGYGVAASFFALAKNTGRELPHYCSDAFLDWTRGVGARLLREMGVAESVIVENTHSHLALAQLYRRAGAGSVRVALLDGSVLFDELMADFAIVDKLLASDGVLLICQRYLPQVKALISFIETNSAFSIIHWSGELTIARRLSRKPRSWNHFVPFDVPREGTAARRYRGLVEITAPDGVAFIFPDEAGVEYYLRRVLNGSEYPSLFPDVYRATIILDVGAQVGSATRCFAARYPDARIVSVEPTPTCFALLGKNTSHLPNVERFEVAFATVPGTLRIWHGQHSSLQNSAVPNAETREHFFDATAVTPLSFCREHGLSAISIVKIDIEGMELDVLRNLQPLFEHIEVFYIEYHSERIRRAIDALLGDRYTLFSAYATESFRGTVAYVRSQLLAELHKKSSATRYVFPKQS